jgi:hypothetical protein
VAALATSLGEFLKVFPKTFRIPGPKLGVNFDL